MGRGNASCRRSSAKRDIDRCVMRVFTDKENGMPLYNVELALKCTMVVQAEDCDDARDIAYANWKEAIDDADARPMIHVTGDVTQERHLRDGWDGQCVPYGGDGNTRISTLLKHND